MARSLTDAAQRAVWARMGEGPFRKGELVSVALRAGQPNVGSYSAVSRFLLAQKVKGAVYYSGPKASGYWTLLPRDQWTGSPVPATPPRPLLVAPTVVGPYDPAPEVEGANNGLTEALAEHLWHDLGAGNREYTLKSRPVMEQRGWREAAERALAYLFSLGLVGPAGPPRERYTGWSYKWLYEANTWEITDEEGGYVAMVSNEADVPLMLAAPDMEVAISELLEKVAQRGGVKRSDLQELAASLPSGSRFRLASPDTPPTPPSASAA